MSQKDESEVLDELFGASDGENEVAMEIAEEFDEENKRKKGAGRSKGIKKKSSEDLNEEVEGSEEVDGNSIDSFELPQLIIQCLDKILEARKDFEEALSKLKGPRRKKGADSDSVVLLSLIVRIMLHFLIFLFRIMMIWRWLLLIKCMRP